MKATYIFLILPLIIISCNNDTSIKDSGELTSDKEFWKETMCNIHSVKDAFIEQSEFHVTNEARYVDYNTIEIMDAGDETFYIKYVIVHREFEWRKTLKAKVICDIENKKYTFSDIN